MKESSNTSRQSSAPNLFREYQRSLNIPEIPVMELLDGEIKRLRERGYTLEQIAEKGGVTRERIRQVINKYYPGSKPLLLSGRQVAKTLGISYSKVTSLRESGLVQAVRTGNIYRYGEKAVGEIRKALLRPCRICGTPIPPRNHTLCQRCSELMRAPKSRLQLPGEREKRYEAVKRWKRTHKEQERLLTKRKSAKHRAKVTKANFETSLYRVRLTFPGFTIGEQFKAIGSEKSNLLLADGRMIPTILVTKVSGPRVAPSAEIGAREKT